MHGFNINSLFPRKQAHLLLRLIHPLLLMCHFSRTGVAQMYSGKNLETRKMNKHQQLMHLTSSQDGVINERTFGILHQKTYLSTVASGLLKGTDPSRLL